MTIVNWYRSQRADFGFIAATWLLWRVLWRRLYVVVCNKILPARFKCPCCGWEGRRFFDYLEMGYGIPNCACPQCDSHPRHRALFLWLRDVFRIKDRRGVALVFAPERALRPLWESLEPTSTLNEVSKSSQMLCIYHSETRAPTLSGVITSWNKSRMIGRPCGNCSGCCAQEQES